MSTAVVSASAVKDLREKTGAGLLDCQKALAEAKGNIEEAITILRKKSGGKVDKLAGRATKEGLIESYIHVGGKVGVLLEVNCETDFVARNEDFKAFLKDLCLQIVSRDQVPEADLAKERDVATASLEGKPAAAIQKIVEGKLEKYYSTVCLIDQPFVKQPEKTVKDILGEAIAKIRENITIRRFTRYQLGN
jgi:elongation factor Ts